MAGVGALRILLVDDNIDHVQLAMRALRTEAAWVVDVARSGGEGLDKAAQGADIVLLDYRLPDMSGLEVLRQLRAKGLKVPVLLMTSQGSEEVAIEALRGGAMGYVVKDHDFGKRLAYEVREWAASEGRGPA